VSGNNSKKESPGLEKLLTCYLYISANPSLLEDTIGNMRKYLEGKINFDTDFMVFNGGDEIDEEELFNYTDTPSLFSPAKVIIIKNIDSASQAFQKKLADSILRSASGSGKMVFMITALKQKLSPALMDTVRGKGKIVQIKAPVAGSLKKWLDEKSESDGIRFTDKARDILVENVNMDLNLLKREYEKLYDYIISEKDRVIDEDTVSALVKRVYSLKVFDLVDYVGQRDKENSLKALKAILDEDQNLIGVITLLYRMFRCFAFIKSGNGHSSVTDYIERNFKVHPYIVGKLVNKYIKFSSNYTEGEILKIFDILNRYDIDIRAGMVESKNLIKKLTPEIIDVRCPV